MDLAHDLAHQQTDKDLAKLERRVRKVYSEAQKDLQQKLDTFTRKFQERDKLQRRRYAKGEITEEQYKAWLRGQIFQSDQWKSKLDQITDTLIHADQVAQKIINGEVAGVFANNANWQSYLLEHEAGLNFGFELYDASTVERLLRDNPKVLPKYRLDIPKDQRWNQSLITRQITQGIIQGERLDQIAKRLEKVTDHDRNLCLTRARTAMTGAQNAGRQESLTRAAAMHIKTKKEWLATLDHHTRTSHAKLDGQQVDIDKPFEVDGYRIRYPGDPHAHPAMVYNCRCTMIGELVDYPDTDEDGVQRRDNISGKPIKDMTYAEWQKAKAVEKPVETVEKSKRIPQLNGIRGDLGDDFVDHMQEMLEAVDNPAFRDVYYKYGDRLGVIDAHTKGGAHYDAWTKVPGAGKVGGVRINAENVVKGDSCHRPYQTAFHEFGHNIDRLATGGGKWLSLEYKNGALGKAIKADYKAQIDARVKLRKEKLLARARETVNNYSDLELRQAFREIGEATGKDFSGLIRDLRHGAVTREQVIEKYRKDLEKNEYSFIKDLLPARKTVVLEFIEEIKNENRSLYEVGAVSDILEGCTGISYPLGVGHGASYHKKTGYTPLEFFAETCDSYIARPESYEQMKRFFPTAVGIVEEMVEMLAK